MEKDFIPYDRALRLKAIGFYCDCFGDYFKFGNQNPFLVTDVSRYRIEEDNEGEDLLRIPAPTFSQAFRWFREKYDYAGFIQLVDPEYGGDYGYVIYYNLNYLAVDHWNKGFKTYEQAELACLDKLLEIVESKSE